MMKMSRTTLMIWPFFVAASFTLSAAHGFVSPSGNAKGQVCRKMVQNDNVVKSQNDEADLIRCQIEEMRQEAIERLDQLNKQVENYRDVQKDTVIEVTESDMMMIANTPSQQQSQQQIKVKPDNRNRFELLDGTTWKLAINIGREPGTWMPETWGVSGQRLSLNLVVDFTSDQSFEREEFLNSMVGAKILKVIDSKLTVGPSLTEGSQVIGVKDGGWRIAPGEGPAGTDLLRFYLEIEETAQHKGCDVYCPKGRVYCTCGYFPMIHQDSKVKDSIRQDQEALQRVYEKLSREDEEEKNVFSISKIMRTKELFDVRREAQKLNERMQQARIREPEKDLLRFSKDGKIGLTREGGVCCKVAKGLASEYHILGRFGVAAVEKKDHGTDREVPRLRP